MYDTFYSSIFVTCKRGRAKDIIHNFLERGLTQRHYPLVLEVGSNNAEHLEYLTHTFDSLVLIDIRTPRNLELQALPKKVTFLQADVSKLPFEDDYFDRVFMTCVIQHVELPEDSFKEMFRVTKKAEKFLFCFRMIMGFFSGSLGVRQLHEPRAKQIC